MLSLKLQFSTSCQQVFIQHIVNHLFFWQLQLKHSLTNVFCNLKESVSFLVKLFRESFQVDILSLQLHVVFYFQLLYISFFLSNCFFTVFFAISIDFFTAFQLPCSFLRKSSSFGNSFFTVRSSFYRYYPKLSLNRVYPIATCFLLLYQNFTTDKHFIQLSCW